MIELTLILLCLALELRAGLKGDNIPGKLPARALYIVLSFVYPIIVIKIAITGDFVPQRLCWLLLGMTVVTYFVKKVYRNGHKKLAAWKRIDAKICAVILGMIAYTMSLTLIQTGG